MGSDRPSDGFDESSLEELERSMEQEVEGLLELDDLDLIPNSSEQITADLLRAERSGSRTSARRPAAKTQPPHRQRGR